MDDDRSQRERMLAGELYRGGDPDLKRESLRAMELTARYNSSSAADAAGRRTILAELLGSVGHGVNIRPPFNCDSATRSTSVRSPSSTSVSWRSTSPGSRSAPTSRSAREFSF